MQQQKKYRFLHIAFHIHQQLFFEGLIISGFYNHHRVFELLQNEDPMRNPNYYGKFGYWHQEKGKLDQYDIIFVGISRPELQGNLMSLIREELGVNSKTKVVANVDYAVEMWPMAFNATHLRHELDKADYIFAAEKSMVSHLKALMNNRTIHYFSHPTDLRTLKKLGQPIEGRQNRNLAIIHRYDNNWMDMYIATKDLKGIETYAVLLDPGIQVECLPYFQFTVNGLPYPQFMEMLSHSRICMDSYHKMHSYGRMPVECACLRVPIVSTDWVTSATEIWPEITVPAGDIFAQREMAQRLIDDPAFYKTVTDLAYDRVEACGYEASMHNFLKMLES